MSIIKLALLKSFCLYLLYETFVNQLHALTVVLLLDFAFSFWFFLERCYHPERNLGRADFLSLLKRYSIESPCLFPALLCSDFEIDKIFENLSLLVPSSNVFLASKFSFSIFPLTFSILKYIPWLELSAFIRLLMKTL